ncbi:potassium channel family protein [Candidatus Contubernalis alkaliaceticus]|uniref:potassium channel family protein n=1 Tax=Candidatus Contubernalis alkaliaceticus TaxID=338645 RepID=UPI001F4BF3B9|nr:TrkA family potassium uptake protein [Candidatus Contubernalis alkalaceticus]UNC92255.1 TrkA family potassium uptake protein [Candidatus Contubernalis alkalaceticus]
MYVLIIGCGKLGSYIANLLSSEGQDVVVIDKDSDSFKGLSSDFSGFSLVGDATEIEMLEEAKIKNADIVVTVTENDNVNMMLAQIARDIYNVPQVFARVFEPAKTSIYDDLNINTICPTTLSALRFRDLILKKEQMEDL